MGDENGGKGNDNNMLNGVAVIADRWSVSCALTLLLLLLLVQSTSCQIRSGDSLRNKIKKKRRKKGNKIKTTLSDQVKDNNQNLHLRLNTNVKLVNHLKLHQHL